MPEMLPIDPHRNITFLGLDIDRDVGGPHKAFTCYKHVRVYENMFRSQSEYEQTYSRKQLSNGMYACMYLFLFVRLFVPMFAR